MNNLDNSLLSTFRYVSNILSIIIIMLGFIFLLGWAFDITIFKTPFLGFPTVKANVSLCFVLIGISLFLLQQNRVNNRNILVVYCFAFIISIFGFLTLIEYALGINLGIDQILFKEASNAVGTLFPNRMPVITAISLIILGVALSFFDMKIGKKHLLSQYLFMIIGIIALLLFIAYFYRTTIYSVYQSTLASPYAVITLGLIFFAGIFARPDKGFMTLITSNNIGSSFLRRILPAIIVVPLIIGILRLLGEDYNLFDTAFGTTLVIFITILILVVLSLISARSINEIDIEREKAEEQVKSQAELLDITHEAIIVRDMDSNIIFWNKGSEEMYGWNKDDVEGKTTHQLLKTEFPIQLKEIDEKIIKTGEWSGELIHTKRDGTKIVVSSRWALKRDRYNNPISILEVNSDITERKKAEENLKETLGELKRSNEELEKFAYVASHDLQEPLRMIVSYLQLFERRYKDKLDEKGTKYMYYAVDGAKRMQGLINDLLTYSRVSTRGEEFKSVDTESLLEETLLNLNYSIKKNNVTIEIDPLPTIVADSGQMVQLFQNLIGNAIKFRKKDEPPRIHISARKEGDEYIFSVQDNGIGIDPKYANRIFEVFQRLQKRSEYEGTGIGLAICKKIVERHGGSIWVDSKLNEGSTFYFSIPITNSKK